MVDIKNIPQEEMVEKVRGYAKENFRKGLNCAESVYAALCDAGLVDFPKETVALATGFGGGIGLSGGVCGSLAAAAMAVGAVHGRRDPAQGSFDEIVDKLYGNPGLYRFFNQLPHRFEERFGSTQCEVLNKDYPSWFDKDRFRKCMSIVIDTAGMAVEMIYQGADEGFNQPFGKNMAGKQ
jgi:C_GCAxxG_C_C family probable redox protein